MTNLRDRDAILAELAERLPRSANDDCVRIAVDGVDGAGKTTFADELAAVLQNRGRQVVRIRADDFLNVRAVRYGRGRESPEGFWLDSYNYRRLHTDVLDPFGPNGSRRYRRNSYDPSTDTESCPPHEIAPAGAVLLLDGLFLHRDDLVASWDFSIFLDVPFRVAAARMVARDGTDTDPDHPSVARYTQGQQIYLAACEPLRRASVVVDNADLDRPRITFRD